MLRGFASQAEVLKLLSHVQGLLAGFDVDGDEVIKTGLKVRSYIDSALILCTAH